MVGEGWIRGAWFAVTTPTGERAVTAYDLDLLGAHAVTRTCLVGAIVHAGGGPGQARSQPVQRALDLTWHTLREEPSRPVAWCPGPPVRALHVLDLTHWNDAPHRTRDDVVRLLAATGDTVNAERERCRVAQQSLPPVLTR